MFWIITGGTLLAFFYLFIFSLCKAAQKADRVIELNLQEMESKSTEEIDKVLFKDLLNESIHEVVKITENESCEDSSAIAKIGLAGFSSG